MRSRSSTSCLKVGLCEGTACQQSRIIMYLWQGRQARAGRAQAHIKESSPGGTVGGVMVGAALSS